MKNKWIFLSYVLSDKISSYGNGKRIEIERIRQINKGDTSNNSALAFPSHTGSHIDFPNHFIANAKTVEDYSAESFIHSKIDCAEVSIDEQKMLIDESSFQKHSFKIDTTFFIIKTGYCNQRSEDSYWNNNPGIAPTLADFLKIKMPQLRAIGLDTISLSGWNHRELGRAAHKEFLGKNEILIVEDLDLTQVSTHSKISSVIISPLRFEAADGTPVTVFAEINA